MRHHEIPPRAIPKRDDTYLEILTQAVFQAGFSWQVVRAKWPHFRKVFKGFRIVAVARFTPRDVERLVKDPGLIRNARKIRATVDNTRRQVDSVGGPKPHSICPILNGGRN